MPTPLAPEDERASGALPDGSPIRQPNLEHWVAEYAQVCQTHRVVTDFRAKLLAFLPLATGTGVFLLITEEGSRIDITHLLGIAGFGFVVTLGLFIHELRGIRHCTALIDRGKELEAGLALGNGQFTREQQYYSTVRGRTIGPEGSAWLIYPAVLAAWLYLGYVSVNAASASALRPSAATAAPAAAQALPSGPVQATSPR